MPAQFSWAAGADVLGGVASTISQWGTVSAQRIVANAQADSQNKIRGAQNGQRASALSLAATVRSMANAATLTNAGDSFNSASELLARTHEAAVRGDVEQGIRDAEALGAYTARAAASGMGGASVQAVNYSIRLQQARLAERTDEKDTEVRYELLKQRSGIMPSAASRLDISPLNPNLDYSMNLPVTGGGSSLAMSLIQGLLTKRESLQVALNSIPQDSAPALTTGDFARMDRSITIS